MKLALQQVDLRHIKSPHGGSSGHFTYSNFFGWSLCNIGYKPSDARLVLWSGVVAGEIFEYIRPVTAGIPKIIVGIGLWSDPITDEDQHYLEKMVRQLNRQPGVQWTLSVNHRDIDGPAFLISIRQSLIDVHVRSAGGDLDGVAGEFFQTHCAELVRILALQLPGSDKPLEQYLFALAGAE
ncbi:hypothetical protein [Pseudomonas akapageensis]|uniref:hypothetical protein n=1 Tax=Pseudomonas akapageensis TaxID=2609961 RepID=UPI001409F073|nr:hypothetical protein [Pseudomonas akapageensis]